MTADRTIPVQERFRWSVWPISVGWALALWLGWHGLLDLAILAKGGLPARGFVFGFLGLLPSAAQMALAAAQMGLVGLAAPSFIAWARQRVILAVGDTGLTIDGWRGWARVAWKDIERLEFRFGDAIFHVREAGRLRMVHVRPWTIGLDRDSFRDLIERHQPRLTPDDDAGQPWGRSSGFRA